MKRGHIIIPLEVFKRRLLSLESVEHDQDTDARERWRVRRRRWYARKRVRELS